MKPYIELFKKIWSNKKYRAFILLGLYFIFFLFVFSIDRIPNVTPVEEVKPLEGIELFKTVTKYKYTINDIHVTVDNDISIEYLNNYYTMDNIIDELKEYDYLLYNPEFIYKIISNSVLESTNYVLNTNTYIISATKYNELFNSSVTDDIKTVTYMDEKNIKYVEVYFKDYTLVLEVGY